MERFIGDVENGLAAGMASGRSFFGSVRSRLSSSLADISQSPSNSEGSGATASNAATRKKRRSFVYERLTLDTGPLPRRNHLELSVAEEIRKLLPARLHLQSHWTLVYSLERDGVSLSTLYEKCRSHRETAGSRPGYVLAVRAADGSTFGAFVNEHFHPYTHYYGNGECFLWKGSELQGSSTERSASPTRLSMESIGDNYQFKAFPYAGLNDYMIFCSNDFLSVGGGDGKYGLWIDSSLESGVTSRCATFGNEPLVGQPGSDTEKFTIINVEVWLV